LLKNLVTLYADVDVIKGYTTGMNEWLIATGMEQYKVGVGKRTRKTTPPPVENQKLATFNTNSQNLNLEILEKPDGKYLKKDPTTKKWYEVKTPGEKIDIEGADGYSINHWRTNVFGLPEIEGGSETIDPPNKDNGSKTKVATKAELASTNFKSVDYPANSNFGNVDSPFAGLTQEGWNPSKNPASQDPLKSGDILFNYGSDNLVINTLTREYGDIGDGFTFSQEGLASDSVRVCYDKNQCKEFKFDTTSNDNDKKSALALQKWMEEKIGYTTGGKKEGRTAAELIGIYK